MAESSNRFISLDKPVKKIQEEQNKKTRAKSQNKKKTVLRKACSIRKLNRYSLLREKVFKLPYVLRLLLFISG